MDWHSQTQQREGYSQLCQARKRQCCERHLLPLHASQRLSQQDRRAAQADGDTVARRSHEEGRGSAGEAEQIISAGEAERGEAAKNSGLQLGNKEEKDREDQEQAVPQDQEETETERRVQEDRGYELLRKERVPLKISQAEDPREDHPEAQVQEQAHPRFAEVQQGQQEQHPGFHQRGQQDQERAAGKGQRGLLREDVGGIRRG